MHAIVYDGARVSLRTAPVARPSGDQALIRIHKAGICNTDLEIFAGYMGFRGTPGHEFVGHVESGAPEWVGQRVVGEINVADGICDLCQRGLPTQCRARTTVGIDRHDGAFAEYLTLTARNLHIVPDSVSDDQAVFVEPLAAAVAVPAVVDIGTRERVIVIGAGRLGLLVAQVLKLTGCDLSVVTRRAAPATLLEKWGIHSTSLDALPHNRADVVIDCTGNADGFASALDLVTPRGTIVLKSTYTQMPSANLTRVVIDEIRVIGSRCGSFPEALRLLEHRLVDVESLIEARYPLERALEAIAQAGQPGTLKVLLEMAS